MAMHRTTLMLDAPSRQASRRLARTLGVTSSEVMRRALLLLERNVLGVGEPERAKRVVALEKLVTLSSNVDVKAELARLRRERDAW
jgi:hypothetical protein